MLDYHVFAYRRHKLLKGLVWLRKNEIKRPIRKLQFSLIAIKQDIGCATMPWRNYHAR